MGNNQQDGHRPSGADEPIALEERGEQEDGRLYSPSTARNREAVFETLRPLFEHNSIVFEVGSGTGEHGAYICDLISHVQWYPSDPDQRSRMSIAAWSQRSQHGNYNQPLDVTTSDPGWEKTVLHALGVQPTIIVSLNMIHISPWSSCVGLFSGGYNLLSDSGQLYLYGPFLEGKDSAPSNLEFDRSLKARNAEWGVRSLDQVVECAEAHGFQLIKKNSMPANNLSLVFHKRHQEPNAS